MVTMVGLVSPEPMMTSILEWAASPTSCLLEAHRTGGQTSPILPVRTLLIRSDAMRSLRWLPRDDDEPSAAHRQWPHAGSLPRRPEGGQEGLQAVLGYFPADNLQVVDDRPDV